MSTDFDWEPFRDNSDVDIVAFDEPGATVTGKITFLQRLPSKFKPDPVPVLIIETDAGPKKIWASSIGLQRALASQKPQVGDKIRIKFDHEEDTGGGNPLKVFDVAVKRAVKAVEEETF